MMFFWVCHFDSGSWTKMVDPQMNKKKYPGGVSRGDGEDRLEVGQSKMVDPVTKMKYL